ncbi:hypothetical protein [Streptomyces broussonetiae]|uniref:hypothetical protein n=1 Tax=Streptomyces broussonetiae TaxID=2686304 RepID=UPI001E2F9C53|nr:hypothetical protein [Streptomyces broussonetiae]
MSDPPHASFGPDVAIDENRLEELIIEARTALPFALPDLVNRCASALVLGSALIYLVDLQQRLLVPLDEAMDPLPVGDSSAGWAYRTVSSRVAEADDGLIAVLDHHGNQLRDDATILLLEWRPQRQR